MEIIGMYIKNVYFLIKILYPFVQKRYKIIISMHEGGFR